MSELADFPAGNRRQNLPQDRMVGELAAKQDGVVGLGQLESLGISEGAARRSLNAGRLHPVLPAVYARWGGFTTRVERRRRPR